MSAPTRARGMTTIIVPTYNERETLPLLLEGIARHVPGADILVVDDHSPDGTGELAEELKKKYPRLDVLHRPGKEGLGRAYLAAFRHVLDRPADFIVTMDADLSHDPAYLPDIIGGLASADVVVGSRYLRGISIVNWPLSRLILSWFGNGYARFFTGLPVRDCTSGFMGYRRRALESIPLDHIASNGYSFTVEMKFACHRLGFALAETPIIFRERDLGRSKMSGAIALEACWKVPAMRLRAGRYRGGGTAGGA